MIETELKFTLDAAGEARLRRHAGLEAMRLAPRRTQDLVSIYYDTPDQALAAAGMSLRLRKVGRRWIQTIKRRADDAGNGLFSNHETECPAPGGRLVPSGADPAFAAVAEARAGAPLAPLFETRVRRTVERLGAPGGGEIELALDRGTIVAGDLTAPILEAEFELKAGDTGAVFEVARALFDQGPVRFATANKSARGYALARGAAVDEPLTARTAGALKCAPSASVETVARDVLRDCFAQISRNMVVVAASDMIEGPHQLRVGLRRLRTALAVFSPSFGGGATEHRGERGDLDVVEFHDALLHQVVESPRAGDDDVDAESARRRDSGDLAVFARCTECDEPGLESLCKRIVDDSVADHERRHFAVALVEPDEERGVDAGDGGGEFEFRAADPVGGVRVAHVDQLCHRSDVVLGLVFAAWPTPPTSLTDP